MLAMPVALGVPLILCGKKKKEDFTPPTKCLIYFSFVKLWPPPAFCRLPFIPVKAAELLELQGLLAK